jgi:hypothetical protein
MKPPPKELAWDATPRQCREFALRTVLTTHNGHRREQIQHKLKHEPRDDVCEFCIQILQGEALALRPWVSEPIWWLSGLPQKQIAKGAVAGDLEMAALVERMKSLKISLYHPSPARALEQAEAAATGAGGTAA